MGGGNIMNMNDRNAKKPEGREMNYQLQKEIDYVTIGRHMKEVRKRLGYTQAQFSELMGMSPNYYGQYETGSQFINLPRFIQFACITETPADTLLAGCHVDYPSPHKLPLECSEQRARLNSVLDKYPDHVIASLIIVAQEMLKQN